MIPNRKGFLLIKNNEPIMYSSCYVAIFATKEDAEEENKLQKDTQIKECFLIIKD